MVECRAWLAWASCPFFVVFVAFVSSLGSVSFFLLTFWRITKIAVYTKPLQDFNKDGSTTLRYLQDFNKDGSYHLEVLLRSLFFTGDNDTLQRLRPPCTLMCTPKGRAGSLKMALVAPWPRARLPGQRMLDHSSIVHAC